MDFKNLIEENKQNVKNVIKKFMGRENEDLEQEVYIRVLTAKKYEEKGSFKSWINLIAANVSRDYLKSAKNRHETYVEDEAIFENIKKCRKAECMSGLFSSLFAGRRPVWALPGEKK